MIGYAQVLRDGPLENVWSQADSASLSAYCSEELYEQVFICA